MSFAAVVDQRLVILDLGTGIGRLETGPGRAMLKGQKTIIILLSHYHLDHLIGLTFLPRFLKGKRVVVAGPGADIYGCTVRGIIDRICCSPLFSLPLSAFPMDLEFVDLKPGINHVEGLSVDTRIQFHSDPSLGIRVADFAYLTDTPCDRGALEFCSGCSVLIHDAMFDSSDQARAVRTKQLHVHSDAAGAARFAREAGVKKLVLAHLNPSYSATRLQRMAADAHTIFAAATLGEDLTAVTI